MIPAIDLRGGRVVRLVQGRAEAERVYAPDPVAVARGFVAAGARELHLVDLDGAFAGAPVHLETLAAVARAVPVPVEYGGGLRRPEDAAEALRRGAARVVLGTAALRQPAWVEELVRRGPERVAVALDLRGGRLAVAGWLEEVDDPLGEVLGRLAAWGVQRVEVTDTSRDGTLTGPSYQGLEEVLTAGLPAVLAGGVGSLDDLERLRPYEGRGLVGVIVGRALYDGRIELGQAVARLQEEGGATGADPPDHPLP